ncbi:hypothetical protein Nepgr_031799 [Nepenthes gracilis]|uniref:Uncharacterized protein n=1 Tax=Nepenthes gracilis TaxID=150966 RepID=A0AAD3Y7T7_NEPGR|nr:hypothetical protein Nepgr_031799 [Nepenthes gracilis]
MTYGVDEVKAKAKLKIGKLGSFVFPPDPRSNEESIEGEPTVKQLKDTRTMQSICDWQVPAHDDFPPCRNIILGTADKAFPKAAGLGSFTSLNVKSEVTTLVTPSSVPGPDKLKLKPTETVMEFPYPTPPLDASRRATKATEGWSSNSSKDTDLELRIARKSPSLEAEALRAATPYFSLGKLGKLPCQSKPLKSILKKSKGPKSKYSPLTQSHG